MSWPDQGVILVIDEWRLRCGFVTAVRVIEGQNNTSADYLSRCGSG